VTTTPAVWLAAGVEEQFCPDYHYDFWVAYCTETGGAYRFPRIHECVHRHRTKEAAEKCLKGLKRRLWYVEPADNPSGDQS
jgi:hypothetical protein